jgi:hypothetical protein
MTFRAANATKENSAIILWAFGLGEGLVAIVQSAEWLSDYTWAPRLLPLLAFALSHTKILFKNEVVDAPYEKTIQSDSPIEVSNGELPNETK